MNNPYVQANRDPQLARLFATQNEPLTAGNFLPRLIARLEREQRRQCAMTIAAITTILALAVVFAPWLTEVASVLNDVIALSIATIGSFLTSPIALIVLGALGSAFLPPIFIWRCWRE